MTSSSEQAVHYTKFRHKWVSDASQPSRCKALSSKTQTIAQETSNPDISHHSGFPCVTLGG
jgi:hypothetical protein